MARSLGKSGPAVNGAAARLHYGRNARRRRKYLIFRDLYEFSHKNHAATDENHATVHEFHEMMRNFYGSFPDFHETTDAFYPFTDDFHETIRGANETADEFHESIREKTASLSRAKVPRWRGTVADDYEREKTASEIGKQFSDISRSGCSGGL